MLRIEPTFSGVFSDDLKAQWKNLLMNSFNPCFQYDYAWVSAWHNYIRKDEKPLLLLAKENERIIGIFPLMYRNERRRGLLPFRRIKFLAADHRDFSVVLAREENMEIVAIKSLEWLFSGKLRWELLVLDDLVDGNPVISVVSKWLEGNRSRLRYDLKMGRYFYVNLNRSWSQVLQEMSKDFVRRNINLARNRISKAGSWELISNPKWGAETIISKAAPMHIRRQSELRRASFYEGDSSRKFIHSIIDESNSDGIFRSYWLRFEKKEIAYLLGFEQNSVFYAWNMAFNPEFARFFPSKLLLFEAIKDCYNRKLKEFNFMRGESDYKEKWTKHFYKNYRFIIRNTNHLYGKAISMVDDLLRKFM